MQTKREYLLENQTVSYYLDDSLNVHGAFPITDKVRLVCFQSGFEPLVVAVRSYLDTDLGEDEAIAIAEDYLEEIGWLKPEVKNGMETYVL